jgi:putative Holliday junction resolvase
LSETVLGFDVGARRIGVAVGNDLMRRAQRAAVIDADVADGGIGAIAKLVDEWQPERFVVGVPLPEDTDAKPKSAALARCERFATRIGERFHLPVERVDERYSSIEADEVHRERRRAGVARRAKTLDDVAAEIILQRYFDNLPA